MQIHVSRCARTLVILNPWLISFQSYDCVLAFDSEFQSRAFHPAVPLPSKYMPRAAQGRLFAVPPAAKVGHGPGGQKFPSAKEARCGRSSSALYVSEPVVTSATVQTVQREFPR